MLDFKPNFSLSSESEIIVLSIFVIAAIPVTIFLWKLIRRGGIKFKFFGGEVDVSQVKEPDVQYDRQSKKISNVVVKVTEIVTKMTEIKIRTTLFDQMSYAEQKFILIHDTLSREYSNILSEKIKKINDATGHEDYLFFNNLLSLTLNNSKQTIRELLQHSHLDLYSDGDFQKFARERSDVIIAESLQFLWQMYPSTRMNVTFSDVDQMMTDKKPQVRELLIDIFVEALRISKEKRNEIDILKKELDSYIEEIQK